MAESVDFEWKHIVLELMNQYARRTQGSFIENKVNLTNQQMDFIRVRLLFFNIETLIRISAAGKPKNSRDISSEKM